MLPKNHLLYCFLFFKHFAMLVDFQLHINKEYIPSGKENTHIFFVDQVMLAWHLLLLFYVELFGFSY